MYNPSGLVEGNTGVLRRTLGCSESCTEKTVAVTINPPHNPLFPSNNMLYRQGFIALTLSSTKILASIVPPRVTLNDILVPDNRFQEANHQAADDFWNALEEYGFCSLTGVFPLGEKRLMFQQLQACLEASGEEEEANLHLFDDGTNRKTFATHAVFEAPSSRLHPKIFQGTPKSKACQDFEISSQGFRQRVDQVSKVVAQVLDARSSRDTLLLSDGYASMEDVVFQGDHLEHFHSYEKGGENDVSVTMDWHKDQGLFLLFAPGQLIGQDGIPSQDFYVKLHGQEHLVQFDDRDDLVILLGDGVAQLGMDLEAPWHSVSINAGTSDRLWYGRMVLPPADHLHPATGLSYGEIRRLLNVNAAGNIGCSSQETTARHLQTTECTVEGELLCWHQCMVTAEFGVNETSCAAQGLDLACLNPKNEVWDGNHANKEAGYAPGCIDLETAVIANTEPDTSAGNHSHSDGDDHSHGDGDDKTEVDADENSQSKGFVKKAMWLVSAFSVGVLCTTL